jgi:hypothetical protein
MEAKEHPAQSEVEHESGREARPDKHLVVVMVDNQKKRVEAGPYRVFVFKHAVGVAPEKELDQIVNGVIKPLDDNATINIAGHEVFISHERTGAAS